MTVTEDLRCNSDFSAELNNNNYNDTNNSWSTLQINVSYYHEHWWDSKPQNHLS